MLQVYTLTLLAAGVPASVVKGYKLHLQNMLGLVRGNIYYNLMNWYRCLTCIPVGDTSKFMETMMGVKQVGVTCGRDTLVCFAHQGVWQGICRWVCGMWYLLNMLSCDLNLCSCDP